MPNDRPGDRIRDEFHRLCVEEANRRGLCFGSYEGYQPQRLPPMAGRMCRGPHPFGNIKDNTVFRFSTPLSEGEIGEPWNDKPCRHGCTFLYVVSRAEGTARWGADTKRFEEMEENFRSNIEEGWMVLLDKDSSRGYVVCRARLRYLPRSPAGPPGQAWCREEDLVGEYRFESVKVLFDILAVRPPASIPDPVRTLPPANFCPVHHGFYRKLSGGSWVCPQCQREAESAGVGS